MKKLIYWLLHHKLFLRAQKFAQIREERRVIHNEAIQLRLELIAKVRAELDYWSDVPIQQQVATLAKILMVEPNLALQMFLNRLCYSSPEEVAGFLPLNIYIKQIKRKRYENLCVSNNVDSMWARNLQWL